MKQKIITLKEQARLVKLKRELSKIAYAKETELEAPVGHPEDCQRSGCDYCNGEFE